MRDKSYRRFGVGEEVGRFLRSLRFAGASKNTIDTYEIVLARLTLDHADFPNLEAFAPPIGTEYLHEFLDRYWRDSATATRANRLAVLRSFFKWAVEQGRISGNPTLPIRSPRVRNRERHAYDVAIIVQLVAAQESLRDQCALQLLARMGLRKNELRLLQLRDVDLARNLIVVRHGKGGKQSVLPIAFETLRDDLYVHIAAEREYAGDEYLLYPREARRRPMDLASVHRWFKRCLERAELPPTIEMHELRHTAADSLWRATGNLVLAQQLLRHESSKTTETYLHPTREDLAAAMRSVDALWKAAAR